MTTGPHDPASVAAAEVAAAERALYAAMIARDYAALGHILSGDLVYIHSTGVAESKERYLAALAEGLYEYETIASRNPRLRISADVALVDGIVDMRVGASGQPKELIHLLFVLVWTRQDGAWRLNYRQATRISSAA